MATKPIIATPRGEYDARSLALGDLAIVSTWTDVSPFAANDLSLSQGEPRYQAVGGAGTPWSATLPAVKVDDGGASLVNWSFPTAFGSVGSPFTLFVVCQATQLSPSGGGGGVAFWGTTDGINPPVGIYLFISPAGEAWFICGANGALSGTRIVSPAGLIAPGDRVIITARRQALPSFPGVSAGPMILRVNGVEVASSISSAWTDFWFSPRMHRCNLPTTGGFPGSVDGEDALFAHLLAFGSEASDQEIVQMEAYLAEVWGFELPTSWIPEPRPILTEPVSPPAPKPTDIGRPIVEFDVRQLRDDGMEYEDGDSLRIADGGVGWQDLEITDPQGRTDAGSLANDGNVLFVKNGWNLKRQVDAVRFVGDPINEPVTDEGNFIGWAGGGAFPLPQNWSGNEYSYIGVMRCTDISLDACLFGGTSGIIPTNGNPKKTGVWVQRDGSVAMHQMDEETSGALQPGSSYSMESAPGLVKAGDSVIITVTASTVSGKVLRLNGKQIAANENAVTTLFTEMSAPALGQYMPQQDGPGVDTVGGKDRLIVYFAAFGSLMTQQQIEEYEAFLALTFQISIGTEWAFEPPPVIVAGDTPWISFDPPPQPVISDQRIELDSRPSGLPSIGVPPGSKNFGTWPDTSGSVLGPPAITGSGFPLPTWEEKGWDPSGRALGVVEKSSLSALFNIQDGGFQLAYPGNFLTLFFVVEATDLTGPLVLIGGNSGSNLRNLSVTIDATGAISFNFFDTGAGDNDTVSAGGFVSPGDRVQITCRHGAGGRIIRLDGTEIASSIGTSHLITYPTMWIGNFRSFEGSPMKLAWYSGHSKEVSDSEILEMEAFLRGAFFSPDPPPPTVWAP